MATRSNDRETQHTDRTRSTHRPSRERAGFTEYLEGKPPLASIALLTIALLVAPVAASLPVDTSGTWLQTTHLTTSDAPPNAHLGTSVSTDGQTALIGAPGEAAVHLFERENDGSWSHTARLAVDGLGSRAGYGEAVAIDGDWAAVGARGADAVFLYERTEDGWTLAQELGPSSSGAFTSFGHALALEGGQLAVGAPSAENTPGVRAGQVHLFERTSGTWQQTQVLASSLDGAARLGWSLGLDADVDGSTLVAGAMGAAAIAVFEKANDGDAWAEVAQFATETPWDGFGRSVALGGDTIAVGALSHATEVESGGVYVYERSDGAWEETGFLVPSDAALLDGRTWFGRSVALDGHGERLVVGAPDEDKSPGLPVEDPGGEDQVCRASSGQPVCQHPGAAYVYERGPGGWDQVAKLTALDSPPGQPHQLGDTDRFGRAVAVDASGTTILAGAPSDDGMPIDDAGSAYLFTPLKEAILP